MSELIVENSLFLFLLFSSVLGEVICFNYKGININLPKVGIFIFLLYFIIRHYRELTKFFNREKITVVFLFLLSFWAGITFLLGEKMFRAKAFPFALRYFLFFFMVIALYLYILRNGWRAWILLYYFLYLMAIGGIGQFFFGKEMLPLLKLSHPHPSTGRIIYSFLYHHNIFGNAMTFFFWLGFFLYRRKKVNLFIFILSSVLSIFALFISTSRGGIFSFFVLFIILLFIYIHDKPKSWWILLLILFLFAIGFFWVLNIFPYFSSRIGNIYPGIEYLKKGNFKDLIQKNLLFKIKWDFSGRLKIWREGFFLFKSHPLFGVGPGFYRFLSKVKAHHMHNIFYTILVEQGLIGLVLWIIFIIYAFIKGVKKNHFATYFLLLMLLSQTFGYFFDHSYFFFILQSFVIASIFTRVDE